MKKLIVFLGAVVLIVSCGSSGKKKVSGGNASERQITVVDNNNGGCVAYTEDGNAIVFDEDSTDNYIVYYAKFDIDAEKHGSDRYMEKLVRAEMDSSLSSLKSIITIYGGAFIAMDSVMGYNACYFDDQMIGDSVNNIEIPQNLEHSEITLSGRELKVRQILMLLNVAYQLARKINESNVSGWNNIVSILEPSLNIFSYDIVPSDTIYDNIVIGHVSKINSAKERFSQYYSLLREKQFSTVSERDMMQGK